ncbi:hypothetical protein IIF17_004304 [Salmonella enterica]|jgi:hypothetical protein|nr:hypothetical protein [Salmonella enterica]
MNGFVYLLIIIAIICVMWVGFNKERRSLIYGGVMAFLVVSVVWGFSLDSRSPKTPTSQMISACFGVKHPAPPKRRHYLLVSRDFPAHAGSFIYSPQSAEIA